MGDVVKTYRGKQLDDFIFSMPDGRPIIWDRLSKTWTKAAKRAGVKHISLQHASRHSTTSLIWQKAKEKAMQEIREQLGHTAKDTAPRHYILVPDAS